MSAAARNPILQQVIEQAEREPEKPALITDKSRSCYGELAEAIEQTAASLAHRYGVRAGDRVVLLAHGHAGFVSTYLALHRLGAIAVPLDPEVSANRLRDIVASVEPRLAIAESARLPAIEATAIRFDDVAHASDPAMTPPPAVGLEADRIADVLFTTGTTGKSKGVMLSHGAIAAACAHINAFIGTGNEDIEVLPLPLSHSFGLGRLRCVLSAGATLVLVAGFVNAAGIVRTLREHRATGIASVPAGLAILLSDERFALDRFSDQLKYVEIGSAPMPIAHKRELMRQLPKTRICMHYGLTEASRSAFISFHDDPGHLDSIGRPSKGVAMRIVDDNGLEVKAGTEGHLQVRGRHLMSGYWNDSALTSKTLRDGWLATGDLARKDDDGYFYLGARTSDIINVGGRKVSPQEIEEILTAHPDVDECACVGVPDPQGLSGEIVVTFLVARPGLDGRPKFSELAKLIRKNLEPYKVPRKFIWTDKIPKSSSGKILRRRLKELV